MTFLQLQYFLKVYETGNVSTAAEDLFLTRSALSKAIRELEEEFGCRLFERSAEGLVPTEVGEALRTKGMSLVALMDETDELLHSLAGEVNNTVRVGITPTTGVTIFPRLYRDFVHIHPDISFLPIEGGNSTAQSLLESGRMDVGFTTYSEVFPDRKGQLKMTDQLDSVKLYDTELMLCVNREHRLSGRSAVSINDILEERFVFLKKPLQREAEINHRFFEAGTSPHVVFRASQVSIARQLVSCGMAASIQPKGTLDSPEVAEIPFLPPAPYANVLVWNRLSACKRGVRSFIDFCRSVDYSLFQ